MGEGLFDQAEHMAMKCTGGGVCAKDCGFLQRYGKPGEIAKAFCSGGIDPNIAYECSMCGLCSSVCPAGLDPRGLFQAMRRQAVTDGTANLKPYRRLLAYERKGASSRYSFYHLPEGCNSVLFPGCTLPGTRPGATRWLIDTLRGIDPDMGVVLDCCHKPSEDLGCVDYFGHMFGSLKDVLTSNGVLRVLVACPNCYATFARYAPELEIVTVYEELASNGLAVGPAADDWSVAVHDPCAVREHVDAHAAVRQLIGILGGNVEETRHSGQKTICCGEGGAVGFANGKLAKTWTSMRANEANGNPVVTYCAGCAGMLSRSMDTLHLLDLLANPGLARGGRLKVSGWPMTYLNRLRLKKELARQANGGIISQRR